MKKRDPRMVRLGVIVTPTKTKCFMALKTAPKIGSCPCKVLRLVTVGTSLDHLHNIQYLKLKAIPLLSLNVPAGWFMVALYLSDYHIHFWVTPESTPWLSLRLDGKTYAFAATIFGFKISAYVAL